LLKAFVLISKALNPRSKIDYTSLTYLKQITYKATNPKFPVTEICDGLIREIKIIKV